jgi:hypothetical protein
MITVALCNDTTVMADADLAAIVPALQVQVSQHFAPIYGVDATIVFVPKGQQPPAGAWLLIAADNADEPGALGYHATKQAFPWGIVGVKDDMAAGAAVSVTISHELLEMLGDPYVTTTAIIDTKMGGWRGAIAAAIAYEVCDACEADALAYLINGIKVSDFVLPWWFSGDVPAAWAGKYSYCGNVKEPFSIDARGTVHGLLSGGYIGIRQFRVSGGWTTVNARHVDEEEVNDLARRLDQIIPAENAHILNANGSTQAPADLPKFSRRARNLRSLAA